MDAFAQYVKENFLKMGKRSRSGVVHESLAKRIKECLKDQTKADKAFRFYVKKEHFHLLDLPNLGLSDILVVPSSILCRYVSFVGRLLIIYSEIINDCLYVGGCR